MSAFGDTYYIAFNSKDAGLIVGVSADGVETFRAKAPGGNLKLAAHQRGVFAVSVPPRGFFNFGNNSVVYSYGLNNSVTKFKVPSLNLSNGHGTITVDPTGRTVLFARFDGFEFRLIHQVSTSSDCLVKPDPENPASAGVAAAFSSDGNWVVLGTWDGILSVWQREGTCWQLAKRLETSVGRMIPTLAFDGQIVLGRTLSDPPMLRRWEATYGTEIGAGYPIDARSMYIRRPDISIGDWAERLPIFNQTDPAEIIVEYVTETEVGQLDLTGDAIVERLCRVLRPALASGLVEVSDPPHTCEKKRSHD